MDLWDIGNGNFGWDWLYSTNIDNDLRNSVKLLAMHKTQQNTYSVVDVEADVSLSRDFFFFLFRFSFFLLFFLSVESSSESLS